MTAINPNVQKPNQNSAPISPTFSIKPQILSKISLKNRTQSFANFQMIRQRIKRRTLYHVTAEDFNEKDSWKRRLTNLKRVFTQNKLLTRLEFTSFLNSHTRIGCLPPILKQFKSLKSIKLSFGSSPKMNMNKRLLALFRSLRKVGLLARLNIDFTHCQEYHVQNLLAMLKSQPRLTNLQLKNFLSLETSNKTFRNLMLILKRVRDLKTLEFSFSNINDRQCQTLCQALCECKFLTRLSLKFTGCNYMTIEGLQSLSLLIRNPHLFLLDLSFIDCQELGEEILFPTLENMTALPPSLGYPIQDYSVKKRQINGGFEDIRETIISTSCPPFLQNQYAQKVKIYHAYQDYSEGYTEWVYLDFPFLSSLKSLDLGMSHKGTSKIISGDFLKRLGMMTALETFKLTCHSYNLTIEGLGWLTQSLRDLPLLNQLEIIFSACYYMTEKEIHGLALGLKELKSLKTLALTLIKCQFEDLAFEGLAMLGAMDWLKSLSLIIRRGKIEEESWLAHKFKKRKGEVFFRALDNLKRLENLELSLGYFNITNKELQVLQSSIKGMKSLKKIRIELYFNEVKSGFDNQTMKSFKTLKMKFGKKEGSSENLKCMVIDLRYLECLYKVKVSYLEERHEDFQEPSRILEGLLHFFLTENSKIFEENLEDLVKLSKLAQSKSRIVFLEISIPFEKSVQDLKILSKLIPKNLLRKLRYSINVEEIRER